jgi:origin recognition complex subunit 5
MYPPPIFLTPIDSGIDYTDEEHEEDSAWVWSRFCVAVWDSLGKGAARDLESFRAACHKLWRLFVQPIVDGMFGTRDFSRLLVNRRPLLRSDEALLDGIVTSTTRNDESRSKGESLD